MTLENQVLPQDEAVHSWYRFVLAFPPHLVRDYLVKLGIRSHHVVLDPFCGTGTTPVECKKLGIKSIGVESHPFLHMVSSTKVDWNWGTLDRFDLLESSRQIFEEARSTFEDEKDLRCLPDEIMKLIPKGAISPLPLHKTLILLEVIDRRMGRFSNYHRLALAKCLPQTIGNLRFGPEVYVAKQKEDAEVFDLWRDSCKIMAHDLVGNYVLPRIPPAPSVIYRGDARLLPELESIDAVICSPPYPAEKDYTRTTRLESVLLGFIRSKKDLRDIKEGLLRSNTRNVFSGDEDGGILTFRSINRLVEEIEARRNALGKTSGFERAYEKVVRLYFQGMREHFTILRNYLSPGASLAYVVGDQASFFRVKIRTAEILSEIANSLGYKTKGIDLFRTRFSTATKEYLNEEVLVLRWTP
jgi:hypothetical protein